MINEKNLQFPKENHVHHGSNPYCALWAYVSCHVYFSVLFQRSSQKKCKHCSALFLTVGNLAVTSLSHGRASRLWVWLYTSVKLRVCLYIDKLLEKY